MNKKKYLIGIFLLYLTVSLTFTCYYDENYDSTDAEMNEGQNINGLDIPLDNHSSDNLVTKGLSNEIIENTITVEQLAFRWAPVHHQELINTEGNEILLGLPLSELDYVDARYDYITRIDRDLPGQIGGDWDLSKNWDMALSYPLRAYVYYSVVSSDTHFYITYSFYHPWDSEVWSIDRISKYIRLSAEESIDLALSFLDENDYSRIISELYRTISTIGGPLNYINSEICDDYLSKGFGWDDIVDWVEEAADTLGNAVDVITDLNDGFFGSITGTNWNTIPITPDNLIDYCTDLVNDAVIDNLPIPDRIKVISHLISKQLVNLNLVAFVCNPELQECFSSPTPDCAVSTPLLFAEIIGSELGLDQALAIRSSYEKNDLEGVLFVIKRNGGYGTLESVIAQGHGYFHTYFPAGKGVGSKRRRPFPLEFATTSDGIQRVKTSQEGSGHGAGCLPDWGSPSPAWPDYNKYVENGGKPKPGGNRYIVYYPSTNPAEEPDTIGRKITHCKYNLINMLDPVDGLWNHADDPKIFVPGTSSFVGGHSGAPWGWRGDKEAANDDDTPKIVKKIDAWFIEHTGIALSQRLNSLGGLNLTKNEKYLINVCKHPWTHRPANIARTYIRNSDINPKTYFSRSYPSNTFLNDDPYECDPHWDDENECDKRPCKSDSCLNKDYSNHCVSGNCDD